MSDLRSAVVSVTEGNLRNSHLYLRDAIDLFPEDAVGGSNSSSSGVPIYVAFGDSEPVETDIDGDKKIFRTRAPVRDFFEQTGIAAGDQLRIEHLGERAYRVSRIVPVRIHRFDGATNSIASLEGRNVWLTSQWGFGTELWGQLGFSDPGARKGFIDHARPGALVAIYVTKDAPDAVEDEKGKLVGVVETTGETGDAKQFIEPAAYMRKQRDPERSKKWNYAIRISRAWKIHPEHQPLIDDFSDITYPKHAALHIGARGVPLNASEIAKLAALPMVEVPVYGTEPPETPLAGPFGKLFGRTNAVPPGRSRDAIDELDGPRHLYVLKLDGPTAAYLGRREDAIEGLEIVKVGLSGSPGMRRYALQAALPNGAFTWRVLHSTMSEERKPYSTFDVARVGEDRMKTFMEECEAEWLGGEFYLADENTIQTAWLKGIAAANNAQADFEKANSAS